jgi:hypothetical protein
MNQFTQILGSAARRALLSAVLLLSGIAAFAQVTTSSISGLIRDKAGEDVVGASVIATHVPSGTRYGTTTNVSGRYVLPAVRVGGPFTVVVTYTGYEPQTQENVTADLGSGAVVNFTLEEVGTVLNEVVVAAQRNSLISSERTGVGTNIRRDQFERLPTIGRSFTDFSALTPQAGPGFSFGGRSNLYNNFSIDGATSNNVFGLSPLPGGQSNAQAISVDAIQELNVSLSPYDVSQGSFTGAGVNAVTRSGTNELEGSAYFFYRDQSLVNKKLGDQDNPITNFDNQNFGLRLGGAIIKNKLFYFVNVERETRNDPAVLFAADGVGANGSPYQQTSAELNRLRDFLLDPAKGWTYDPGTFDNFNAQTQSWKYLARIDYNINDMNKLSVRYNQLNSFRDVQPSNSGGFASAPPGGRGNTNNTLPFSSIWYRINNNLSNIIAELNTTAKSGRFSNNFQVGYSAFRDFRESVGGAASPDFPTVDILGPNGQTLTSFGAEPFTPNNRLDQDVIQINDKFDLFLGNHRVSIGTANEIYSFYNVFTPLIRSSYQFNSINDFINNVAPPQGTTPTAPTQYAVQYSAVKDQPAPAADWSATQLGFYAQDQFTGIKNLSITFGVRADIPIFNDSKVLGNVVSDTMTFRDNSGNPETIRVGQLPESQILWSPRLGFNWDVTGDKKTQVRGGTGIFTGRIPFVWVSNQVSNNGVFFGTASPSGADLAGIRFNPANNAIPLVPAEIPDFTGVPVANEFILNSTVSNFRFPQVWRSSLGIDRSLPGGFLASVEGIFTQDINAIYVRDANLAAPVGTVAGDGRPLYGAVSNATATTGNRRVNRRVIQALMLDNISEGYAYSFTAQLQKVTGPIQGMIAYTFTDSRDVNNQSGSTAGSLYTGNAIVGNPNLPNLSFANNLVPHRFTGFVSWRHEWAKPLATTLSFIYTGNVGGNFSYIAGGSVNSDGINNNDLMYIPNSPNEIILAPTDARDTRTPEQIWEQLNNYISQDEYLNSRRGQYAERNGAFQPWVHVLNMRLLADVIPFRVKEKKYGIQFSWEVQNFLNLINSEWGVIRTVNRNTLINFVGYETANTATAPATGRPVYTFPTGSDGQPLSTSFINNPGLGSRYQMQLGVRLFF